MISPLKVLSLVSWALRPVGEGKTVGGRESIHDTSVYTDGMFAYPVGSPVRFHTSVEHSTTILRLLTTELSGG